MRVVPSLVSRQQSSALSFNRPTTHNPQPLPSNHPSLSSFVYIFRASDLSHLLGTKVRGGCAREATAPLGVQCRLVCKQTKVFPSTDAGSPPLKSLCPFPCSFRHFQDLSAQGLKLSVLHTHLARSVSHPFCEPCPEQTCWPGHCVRVLLL
jgi:hypothetical protein